MTNGLNCHMPPSEPLFRVGQEAVTGSNTDSHESSLGWLFKAVDWFQLMVQHPEYRFGSGQLQSLNEP